MERSSNGRPYMYRMGIVFILVHYERGGKRAMKQTFDQLRGAILDKAFKVYDGTIAVDIHDVGELINEAEAKWEAEVCEWKRGSENENKDTIFAPHEEVYAMYEICLAMYPYCPYCGKRIKISEVE